MKHQYPEIDALKIFYTTNNIQLVNKTPSAIEGVFNITLLLNNISFIVLIQDEYDDLDIQNSLLHLVLVLRDWQLIEDSKDYLDWCKIQGFTVTNEYLRQYYQDATTKMPQILNYFEDKKMNSFISDLDFQLNAGAAQFLRNTTYK